MDVTREAIELGNDDWTVLLLRQGNCRGELWTSNQGIGAFAGLDLGEPARDYQPFSPRERLDRSCLCAETQTGAALTRRRNANVSDN
jgi:hypothetical protein